MASGIAIETRDLSKTYKGADTPAVDNISFSINGNSFFGLLGPNGAGKTTTISILCGLIKPSAGSVSILGMSPASDLEKIKQRIGVVPQDIALYPTLTAYENLRYVGNMYGLKGEELKKIINEHLEIVGLQTHAHKQTGTFSAGMKRRINLIAGILHKPEILFLDEPTVGVDVQSRNLITEHLKLINGQGCTVVYTSHLMEEAEKLCTDIVIVDNGRIIARGKPAELVALNETGNLEQLFLKLTGKQLRD